jgi:hypothetical protein
MVRRMMKERNEEYRGMENFLYACMYDVINADLPPAEKRLHLNRYKAKLVRLHAQRTEGIMLDQHAYDKLQGEPPSLFHVLKQNRRREARTINSVQDRHGAVFTSTSDICVAFANHFLQTYAPIPSDNVCTEFLARLIRPDDIPSYEAHLDFPITADELRAALRKGERSKTPGVDGICLEFYTENWDTLGPDLMKLVNHMFQNCAISPQQNRGIVVCLPKDAGNHNIIYSS